MTRKIKRSVAVFLVMLCATTIFGSPVISTAKEEEPQPGMHADITTFEKNYELTMEQKKETIEMINTAVSYLTDNDMSDLEKYYRLALWENDRATYDGDFWAGGYYMSKYRHQWDSYGVLTDKSVCAGIAITYAVLCHAAGLPCKFVRTYPEQLDHTINYIPDINGNAYYVDVTEGDFILSEKANAFGPMVDKEFAYITKDCTDGAFEYIQRFENSIYYGDKEIDKSDPEYKKKIVAEEVEETRLGTRIKECFKITYDKWFKEFALHQDTTKEFASPYVELGSGVRGQHRAKYSEFPKQFSATEKPDVWFLEDFYKNPKEIRSIVEGHVLDEQVTSVTKYSDYYTYDSDEDFLDRLMYGLSVTTFPSMEDGEIVPQEKTLMYGEDYTIKVDSVDKVKREAKITIEGTGKYTGSYQTVVNLMKDNPIKVSGKKVTVKQSKLAKKAQTIKRADAIKVSKAKGPLRFYLSAVTKGTKNYKKYFTINEETGNITIKKALKKGIYKVKAMVMAYGDDRYSESPWKTVTVTVQVK